MRRRPGRRLFLLACALVTIAGCGSGGGGTTAITARGVLTFSEEMRDGAVAEPVIDSRGPGNRVCEGTGHDSDLISGGSIFLRDARGRIVGTGQLESGTATFKDATTGRTVRGVPPGDGTSGTGTISCTLPFQLPDVVPGSKSYTVAIGDRVPLLRVRPSQLESMVLTLR
jgi:hypothetical protein